jgi:hypothetical protein
VSQALAVGTDFIHALLITLWIAGLPLLVWHRWPRAARIYAVYAVGFVALSQLSQRLLGECFLTAIALHFWEQVPSSAPVSREWFTVRIAQAVFHLAPSHRSIVHVSEALIVTTAVGVLWSLHRASSSHRITGQQVLHRGSKVVQVERLVEEHRR